MRASELHLDQLGVCFLKTPLIANVLGHDRPLYSIRDYIHPGPSDGPEVHFTKDVFTEPTSTIVEKWFDDPEIASRLIHQIAGRR